ncbi:MAG: hypothetical protein ACRCTA_05900, partial [Bacilli bacterium]
MIEQLMIKYGIIFGSRLKIKDKQRFFKQITNDFNECGYETKVVAKKVKRQMAYNIMVGDVLKARKLIILSYSTP